MMLMQRRLQNDELQLNQAFEALLKIKGPYGPSLDETVKDRMLEIISLMLIEPPYICCHLHLIHRYAGYVVRNLQISTQCIISLPFLIIILKHSFFFSRNS